MLGYYCSKKKPPLHIYFKYPLNLLQNTSFSLPIACIFFPHASNFLQHLSSFGRNNSFSCLKVSLVAAILASSRCRYCWVAETLGPPKTIVVDGSSFKYLNPLNQLVRFRSCFVTSEGAIQAWNQTTYFQHPQGQSFGAFRSLTNQA